MILPLVTAPQSARLAKSGGDVMEAMRRSEGTRELAYEVDLIGNIRQVLAGLQGYETMALELLQNADDAGASTIRFDIRKDRLIIRHDSSFSSCGLASQQCDWITNGNPNGGHRPCDFHSVSLMATGGKAREAGQIGRFGIGFVSVYQVTDAPILRSTGVRLRLDPLTRRNQIDDDETGDGTEVILPWADHRTPTRQALQTSATPADVCSRIESALKRVSGEGLLFLQSLKTVEIARSGNVISTVEVTRSPERVNVRIDGIDHPWLMLRGEAAEGAAGLAEKFEQLAELRRRTEVVVAFPLDGRETLAGLLYAFLPTGQEFGLPCHINADFFPRQDRRSIDVTGESHERHFNALLLETAAETMGAALETLRTEIGPERLWDLLQAAGRLEDAAPVFRVFWTALAEAARRDAVGLTTSQRWTQTARCVLPSADFPSEHELAAEAVGLSVIDPALRSRRNILLKLGARQLTLGVLLDAIEAHKDFPLSTEAAEVAGDRTENLWALAETLLPGEKATDRTALLERLTACEFLVDADGEATSIDAQYRAETADAAQAIRRFVPEVPLMSERLRAFPGLFELVDRVTVDAMAGPLARALPTSEAGLAHLGGARGAFELFSLLTGFEVDPAGIPAIRAALANACLLPSGGDLLSPSRALWPGGFSDPIGHFRLIDADRLPPGADRFVREVLGVQVLTFEAYLDDHLEAILAAEPEMGAYKNLMLQIVRHEAELGEGSLAALRRTALVRTEGGRFVRPSDAYERSPERLILLGDDGDWWLDADWLPDGADGFRTLSLLRRLGLSGAVAVRHLAARLIAISASPPTLPAREAVNTVVRHLLEGFDEPDPKDLVALTPPFDRTAAGALFHRLEVPALSTAVRLAIAGLDNERADPEAADAIRRRAPLLLWLAPSADAAAALSGVLRKLTVSRVGALTQRAEFLNGDNPIISPTMAVDAFYDPDEVRLYAKVADDDVEPDWSAMFAHLFANVFQGGESVDLPALILSAVVVVTAASEHAAERALQQAGFRRPELLDEDVEVEPEDEADPESPTYDWGMDPIAPAPSDAEAAGGAAAETAAGPDASAPDTASPDATQPAPPPARSLSPAPSPNPSSPGAGTPPGQGRAPSGDDDPVSTNRPTPGAPGTPPTTVRTQRMLAYVTQRSAKPTAAPGSQAPYDNPIDEAAMQAALAFERKAGRGPVRQSHTNKGYDIVSTDPATGERRLIEVKGLENAWTARGVKVTRTQFATAQHHGEAFWLYVVENAQDTHAQLLTPLRNPFDKVEEYWFDHLWREAAEQAVKGPDILVQPGARLRHKHFGLGTVEKATQRGAILDLVIAFSDSRKSLPFSKEMELVP